MTDELKPEGTGAMNWMRREFGVLKDDRRNGCWSVEQDVPEGETFLAVGDMSMFALGHCCGHSVRSKLWCRAGVVQQPRHEMMAAQTRDMAVEREKGS